MPRCKLCRENAAEDGHAVCYDCGAILFEQWRDDQACAASEADHEAAMALARTGEPEVEYDLSEVSF